MVGRDGELDKLRAALERASTGRRQICFVSGDPGIGKTTLVDRFVDELEDRGVLVARGQCVEQFGTPEPYLAVIEAIGRLRRSDRGDRILATLTRYAPTFLAKVPHLVPDGQLAPIAARAQGSTEARMMRELAEALEAACDQEPLAIVLEDLHWSDLATLDLLASLIQRGERARLLVIGTLRRAALHGTDHPVSRVAKTAIARNGALSIALDKLAPAGVGELLARRFPDHAFPSGLVDTLVAITGGVPLFLVTLLDDLVGRGMLAQKPGWTLTVSIAEVAAHRPDSIRQLIDMQLDRLPEEDQRILEAASLIGAVFETDSVAAALGLSIEHVDDRCDELTRRGLFLAREASIDAIDGSGPISRYAMTHALVQEVCTQRGSPSRQRRWHLAIANHLERTYPRQPEYCHALAVHLEHAGSPAKAIDCFSAAGHHAALRFASADAVALYERARSLLSRVPRTPARDAQELNLLATIGQLLIRTPYKGGDPLYVYERALELAREIGDAPNELAALANLCLRRTIHSEIALALELERELIAKEPAVADDRMLVEYSAAVRGFLAIYRGDLPTALRLFELLLDDTHRKQIPPSVIHPTSMLGPIVRTAVSQSYLGLLHAYLGAPGRAVAFAKQAIEEARRLHDPIALGITENMLARIHVLLRDPPEVAAAAARVVLERATAGWVVTDECRLIASWAACHTTPLTAEGAATRVAEARSRLARLSLGAPNVAPPTAAALWISGHQAEARTVIEETIAYALDHAELLCLPELLVLRGDYAADRELATAAYREAHAKAIELGMPLLELRAATALGDRQLVSAARARCGEQAGSPDFAAADALLR